MWKFLKSFLKEEEDEQGKLQEKFGHFRALLDHNNQALALMADMEEKLSGDFLFDSGYLQSSVADIGDCVTRLVDELNRLTLDRYRDLTSVTRGIIACTHQTLTAVPEIPVTPFILPLANLDRASAAAVGSKMANLGDLRRHLGLAVPAGFAITAFAYKRFLEGSGLAGELAALLATADIRDLEGLAAISTDLRERVRRAELPPDLKAALDEQARQFAGRRLAVRSSAVGEDTEFSFAGQFATLLNVDPAHLAEHYKAVVASKFTSRAIFYWKYQDFSVDELPMAVGCLDMVPARASGVMFSLDPHAPHQDTVVITAVWGLGKFAVDGVVSPDYYEVSRGEGHPILTRRPAVKPRALACSPEGGVVEIDLPPDRAAAPCLADAQVQALAAVALRLEKHFGAPQDIEWAVDPQGDITILQSRPLRLAAPRRPARPRPASLEGVPALLNFGLRAVGGAAAGPVFILRREEDVPAIPPGVVVVTRQPTSRLVLVMDRIAAILSEVGSPTDHMTILAREFRVPTLVEVGGATQTLSPGQMVTVDADNAKVYPGIIPELLERERRSPAEESWRADPVFLKLRQVLRHITPLNLLDPHSPEFAPANCRTLHDVTRFSHEKAMDAMFNLDVNEAVRSKGAARLHTELPINLYILDLGGGLKPDRGEKLTLDGIASRPLLALLRGFHDPRLRWGGQMAVDLKGFMSVFANTLYDVNKADRELGGKSFAIISDTYLNFNSRLGYHFGALDAYVSEERNDNYISFQFKGGAANTERRERRARLLSSLLEDMGFKAQAVGDMVRARVVKLSFLESETTLEMVGHLLAFSRQLDLALASDSLMKRVRQAFQEEDYQLSFLRPSEPAP